MRALLAVALLWMAGPLWAAGLSEAVVKKLAADPEPFLKLAADLIHGFGGSQGIDAAGVDRFVALQRAEARGSALRQMAVADLDFDGRVTAHELGVLAAAASARMRGQLWSRFEAADGDGDGVVSAGETLIWVKAEGLRRFSPGDETIARAILAFDADADGWVTLKEVKAAVAALAT